MIEHLGHLIHLVSSIENTCEQAGLPEEAVLGAHILAIAMRIQAQPEADREVMYGQLVEDVRDHVTSLNELEVQVAEQTGVTVEQLRATLGD